MKFWFFWRVRFWTKKPALFQFKDIKLSPQYLWTREVFQPGIGDFLPEFSQEFLNRAWKTELCVCVCECVSVWVCGCVSVWVCECVSVCVQGD
jgi:hypothetical protein